MARTTAVPAILAAAAIGLALPGCAGPDREYSQTQLSALQTREYDAGFDKTFDAAVAALFDAGFGVYGSDKRGGVVSGRRSGEGVQLKLDHLTDARTAVRISTLEWGQARVNEAMIKELHDLLNRRLTGALTAPPAGR